MRSPTCQRQRIDTAKHHTRQTAGTKSVMYFLTLSGNIHVCAYLKDEGWQIEDERGRRSTIWLQTVGLTLPLFKAEISSMSVA